MMKEIKVINARQNNLKGIDVTIPYYKLCVVTGNSGSGKSSLVYDTIYAESQRLICSELVSSAFGVQVMEKPEVDRIENLCPAISISQQSYNFNPNSTVSTYTDVAANIKTIFSVISSERTGKFISPKEFSTATSEFQCTCCHGTGKKWVLSKKKLIPDEIIPLDKGGIVYFNGAKKSFEMQLLQSICQKYNIDITKSICELSENQKKILLYGDFQKYIVKFERGKKKNCQKTIIFKGAMGALEEEYKKIDTPMIRQQLEKYLELENCSICGGTGFIGNIQKYQICGMNIASVMSMEGTELGEWCERVKDTYNMSPNLKAITAAVEPIQRVTRAMQELSIEYLALDRSIPSLSGGECQRLRMARQISGALSEILYILDEPCRGLHRVDIKKMIRATEKLLSKGNTVLAIEHNWQYISYADKIIELGPESGPEGGWIVEHKKQQEKPLGQWNIKPEISHSKDFFVFGGITVNNLKNISCQIPEGIVTCITGVSGSGKSTLARDVIFSSLNAKKNINCSYFEVQKKFGKVYYVDQKPIGKSSRSSVISYLKIYDEIREVFANVKVNGKKYPSSYFSTNVSGGRCEKCMGSGQLQTTGISDICITCDACGGARFKKNILEVRYNGKNINDVLNMDVDEARQFFYDDLKVTTMLECMKNLGLGYLKLGQLSKNLSGGEAQRLKLAKALGEEHKKESVYILDEPTAGLSENDCEKIVSIVQKLANQGNTVIVIEHDPQFVASVADYIIDFGFQGGKKGGRILAQGYVESIIQQKKASIWFDAM